MKRDNNEFEKLKSRFLRYRVVAYLLFLIVIVTNIKEVVKVWHIIFPYKAIVVRCELKEYEINRYKELPLKLNVVMNSEKQIIINDATIDITFHLFDEKSGAYDKIDSAEISEYFVIDKTRIFVLPLDNQHNKQEIVLKIRCQVAGKYIALIKVTSPKARLSSEEKIYITVRSLALDFLSERRGQTPPIFVVKGDILDVSPQFLFSIGEFKAILLYEAEKTNIVKSTLWFSPGYVGALGGSGLRILRDPATVMELWMRDKIEYHDPYIDEIIDATTENRHMEELGFLSVGSEIVPIGTSFYRLSILDAQRIQFREISVDTVRILVKKKWEWGTPTPSDEWEELEIPKYSITFKIHADCGATGRNCAFMLHFGGKEYNYIEHYEPSKYGIETDFPIFVNISTSINTKYLRIDIEPELIISECIFNE